MFEFKKLVERVVKGRAESECCVTPDGQEGCGCGYLPVINNAGCGCCEESEKNAKPSEASGCSCSCSSVK